MNHDTPKKKNNTTIRTNETVHADETVQADETVRADLVNQTRDTLRADQTAYSEETKTVGRPVDFRGVPKVPVDLWQPGDTLLDSFEIISKLGQGGMGAVYLVKRLFDGRLFAMKTILSKLLDNPKSRSVFIRELRTWIDLPDHSNLTECCFLRTIDGNFSVFAEFVSGGTLDQKISSAPLELPEILDIAIQFGWGLWAAHSHSVVHQDVKPANVLLTESGIVKITDFGLSRSVSSSESGENILDMNGEPSKVSSAGMTAAYCSPEQSQGSKLDHRTDIWSWGVSVLEMFTGGISFNYGVFAREMLEKFLKHHENRQLMTDSLEMLLRKCFKLDPEDRWNNFYEICSELIRIYKEETGTEYPRELQPIAVPLKKMEKPPERTTSTGTFWYAPDYWLDKAFKCSGNSKKQIREYRSKESSSQDSYILTDLEGYEDALGLYRTLLKEGRTDLVDDVILLLKMKTALHEALGDKSGADANYLELIAVLEQHLILDSSNKYQNNLGYAYFKYASCQLVFGKFQEADTLFNKALSILNAASADPLNLELKGLSYLNQASTAFSLQKFELAKELYQKSAEIWPHLKEIGYGDFRDRTALAQMNTGNVYYRKSDYSKAIYYMKASCEIWEELISETDSVVSRQNHAQVLINLSAVYHESGASEMALETIGKSMSILRNLVQNEGRKDMIPWLAMSCLNYGNFALSAGQYAQAIGVLDQAIALYENLVNKENLINHIDSLQKSLITRSNCLVEMGQIDTAIQQFEALIPDIEDHIKDENNINRLPFYFSTVRKLAKLYQQQSRTSRAEQCLKKLIDRFDGHDIILNYPEHAKEFARVVRDMERLR